MEMQKLLEVWKKVLKENKSKSVELGIVRANENGGGWIEADDLSKIFKVFHLSEVDIKGGKFTPRIPKAPAQGEDDFTPRISLAPSISKALEALSDSKSTIYMSVYAGDLLGVPDDDIEYYDLQARLPKCPKAGKRKYGEPGWSFGEWLKANKQKAISPKDLPDQYRQQFYGCVPDADETEELWSLQPIRLYHLGQIVTDDPSEPTIELKPSAVKLIDRYLEALG